MTMTSRQSPRCPGTGTKVENPPDHRVVDCPSCGRPMSVGSPFIGENSTGAGTIKSHGTVQTYNTRAADDRLRGRRAWATASVIAALNGQRLVEVTNVYEDGETVLTHARVTLPQPQPDDSPDSYVDRLRDEVLFPLTGTGRTDGDACYFVKSIDGLEPVINEEWC